MGNPPYLGGDRSGINNYYQPYVRVVSLLQNKFGYCKIKKDFYNLNNQTMGKNIDPKKNPYTTILAVIFLTIGIGSYVMPIFLTVKEDLKDWVKIMFLVGGIMFLFAPDTIIDVLKKFIGRKADEI